MMAIEWKPIALPPVDPAGIDPDAVRARQDALRELLKPGVILRTKAGEIVLVGHINDETGQCNCCDWREDSDDPVVDWATVWSPTEAAPTTERAS